MVRLNPIIPFCLILTALGELRANTSPQSSQIKGSADEDLSIDFNGDGSVNQQDLLLLIDKEGTVQGEKEYGLAFDLNGDGQIGTADVLRFMLRWRTTASARTPIDPMDLRNRIALADGAARSWEFETIEPGMTPPGEIHQIIAALEPIDPGGGLLQPIRSVGVEEPDAKSRFMVRASGDLEVVQVELTKDLSLMTGLAISKDSNLLPSPVPLASPGMVVSGSTVITEVTASIQVLLGPKGAIPMDVDVPYHIESTMTDISDAGDWSMVHGLFRLFAEAQPFGSFDGGFELIFDGEGISLLQTFYTANDRQIFQSYRRFVRGADDCRSEIEPNSSLDQGEIVNPPACRMGVVVQGTGDMADFYRLETVESQDVQIRFSYNSVGPVTATVRDPGEDVVESEMFSGMGEFTFADISLEPGQTYSLEVEGGSEDRSRYTVHFDSIIVLACVSDEESNDDAESANPVSVPGCLLGQARGTEGDTMDFFRLTADRAGDLLITAEYTTDEFGRIRLLDGSQVEIQDSDFLTGEGKFVFNARTAAMDETFFLEFTSGSFGTFTYQADIFVLGQNECIPEAEPNDPFLSDANLAALGRCVEGDAGAGSDFDDNFEVLLPAGQAGNVSVVIEHDVPPGTTGFANIFQIDFPGAQPNFLDGANFTGLGTTTLSGAAPLGSRRTFFNIGTEGGPAGAGGGPFTYRATPTFVPNKTVSSSRP